MKHIRTRLLGIVLAFMMCTILLGGCGPRVDRMRLARKMAPEGPYGTQLARTIAILPVQNRTSVADPTVTARFRQPMTEQLQDRCPQIQFVGPSRDSLPPALSAMGSAAGPQLSNKALLNTTRKNGYVALVGVALADVQVHSVPKGIWIFTYDDFTIEMTVEVVVFSAETGAKQLDTHLTVSEDISDLDYSAFRENPSHPVAAIDDALDSLVEEVADVACEAMAELSWFTRVVSVNDGSIVLNAGESSGLKPGIQLGIFRGDDRLKGHSDVEYRIPNRYLGTVIIESVGPENATASIIDGQEAISQGNLAMPLK